MDSSNTLNNAPPIPLPRTNIRNRAMLNADSLTQNVGEMNGFKVTQEKHAQAYYNRYYKWSCTNFLRGTKNCLLNNILYPAIKIITIVLGCTLLLPYSIYLAASQKHQKNKDIESDILSNFMTAQPNDSSELYLWQVRLKAQEHNEQTKGLCRNCIDLGCPLLWPLTGVCLLADKVYSWLHGNVKPEEIYLHNHTRPSTKNERLFIDNLKKAETQDETQDAIV